jgi:hypothetical protein
MSKLQLLAWALFFPLQDIKSQYKFWHSTNKSSIQIFLQDVAIHAFNKRNLAAMKRNKKARDGWVIQNKY